MATVFNTPLLPSPVIALPKKSESFIASPAKGTPKALPTAPTTVWPICLACFPALPVVWSGTACCKAETTPPNSGVSPPPAVPILPNTPPKAK